MAQLTPAVFFGRKNLFKTITIVFLVCLLTWLGFWQLDRLEWRRGQNAELAARLAQPPALINDFADAAPLLDMVDQRVRATGQFMLDEQVVLKNQTSELLGPGMHLVTPLSLGDGRAVLVNRGWVPVSDDYAQFDETASEIEGVIQAFQSPARNDAGVLDAQAELFRLTFEQMQSQTREELLPVVLLQSAETDDLAARPYRSPIEPDLSEGNHLSYALQWFSFAIICTVGYVFYLRRYP